MGCWLSVTPPLGQRPIHLGVISVDHPPAGFPSEVEPCPSRRRRPWSQVDPHGDAELAGPLGRELYLQPVELARPGDLTSVPQDLDPGDLAPDQAGAAAEAGDPQPVVSRPV